mgnify:CR=1 FL=1
MPAKKIVRKGRKSKTKRVDPFAALSSHLTGQGMEDVKLCGASGTVFARGFYSKPVFIDVLNPSLPTGWVLFSVLVKAISPNRTAVVMSCYHTGETTLAGDELHDHLRRRVTHPSLPG